MVGIVGSLTGSDDDDPHRYVPGFGVVALLFLVPVGATLPAKHLSRELMALASRSWSSWSGRPS